MPDIQYANMISKNLFDLYKHFAVITKQKCHIDQNISWVNSLPSPWPAFIFNTEIPKINRDQFLNKIKVSIDNNEAPPFWINQRKEDDFEKVIGQAGFRKIMQWPGMSVTLDKLKPQQEKGENIVVKKVSNKKNLKAWCNIISTELFSGKQIDISDFEPLIADSYIELYLGFYNEKPVATSMAYFSNEVAGIYMVSTLENFRKKGIGTQMTIQPLVNIKNNDVKAGVLQAYPGSEQLYSGLGFTENCIFDIYWKVGKQYK